MKCPEKIIETLRESRGSTLGNDAIPFVRSMNVLRRNTMGSTADKAKGLANEAIGNVKQGVGKATDNTKLQAEGKLQEKKGEAQQAVGKAKDAVKKTIDKA
jgi:uncharacterized protein YjbJ (UPF0337 family)